jgi:hypothetical protein
MQLKYKMLDGARLSFTEHMAFYISIHVHILIITLNKPFPI